MARYVFPALFVVLNIVWLVWPGFGLMPLAAAELLIFVVILLRGHLIYRDAAIQLLKTHLNELPHRHWEYMMFYTIRIFDPRTADLYSFYFSFLFFVSLIVCVFMLIESRWIEAGVALLNAFLSHLISGWLDPGNILRAGLKRHPEGSDVAQAIEETADFVKQLQDSR